MKKDIRIWEGRYGKICIFNRKFGSILDGGGTARKVKQTSKHKVAHPRYKIT